MGRGVRDQDVVSGPAVENIRPGAADQHVVPVARPVGCRTRPGGPPAELRTLLNAAVRTAGWNGHHRWERLFRPYACWSHLEAGDPSAADAAWADAGVVADDGPFPFGDLMAGVLRGRTLLALGRVDEALTGLDGWADWLDRGRMLMDWV